MSTSVRIVQEFGAIDNEAQRWTLLADEANSPMHQYGWVKACSTAFAGYGRLQLIVIGRAGEEPGALGPLIMRGRHLNRMECLGVDELYEPTDFPHSDPASLAALVGTLVALRRPLLLRRLLANSPVLSAVREAFTSRGILMTRPATGYPWIELDESWMDPEQKISSSWRSSLRRSRRMAEDMGRLQYEIVSPKPNEFPGCWRRVCASRLQIGKDVMARPCYRTPDDGSFSNTTRRRHAREASCACAFSRSAELRQQLRLLWNAAVDSGY